MLIYILIAFLIPWIVWFSLAYFDLFGSVIYTVVSTLLMWMPAIAAMIVHVIRKKPVMHFSWKLSIRKNLKYYLVAWFLPIALTLLGTFVYFVIFRTDFSLLNMETTSLPLSLFILLTVIAAIPASVFNMFFALGEEVGWRGFFYPELSERLGKLKALLVAGIIWGIWHTPVNIMGYNYGTGYVGYPVTGIFAMCLSCIVLGIWCSYLADKTGSIWPPALFHGSINAIGAFGLVFLKKESPYLLGPGITGIIPSIIAGLFLIPVLRGRVIHD